MQQLPTQVQQPPYTYIQQPAALQHVPDFLQQHQPYGIQQPQALQPLQVVPPAPTQEQLGPQLFAPGLPQYFPTPTSS